MDSHRSEIVSTESLYTLLVLAITIVALGLNLLGALMGSAAPFYHTPPFVGCLLGLVMKAAVLIHRKGGWLKSRGDEWEEDKDRHRPSKYLVPWAQLLILQPMLWLVIQAEFRVWADLSGSPAIYQWGYLFGTVALVLLGIAGYIVAAVKAKTGF